MTNIRSVWDKDRENDKDKDKDKNDKKKYEMFSQGGSQSGTGVLRPVKQDMDDLKNLQNQQQSQNMSSKQTLDRAIIIYKNGYKIGEDGEFKSNEIKENQEFITAIKRGEMPKDLEKLLREKYGNNTKKTDMGVNIVDRTKDEYKPPPEPKFKAFQGQGNTLGKNNTNTNNSSLSEIDEKEINVDDKDETIRVQLILNNGKRVTQKLNSTSTVIELYAHVKFLTKYNGKFELLAGFPPKPLTSGNQNVKEAGLNGARVTMKNV